MPLNYNADDEPPKKYRTHHSPPLPSLSSLPDEIVLRCLARVPSIYHLSVSWVSKHLRALVRSPELNRLRSIRHKSSLYLCFEEEAIDPTFHWFTLNETSTKEYGLVLNPKIFFIGGSRKPSTDLWILDTQSGNIAQGPSMTVPREKDEAAVGVIDGKIYVVSDGRFHEEMQVEVFDTKSETWELAGLEKVPKTLGYGASVELKVNMVDYEDTSVDNPRGSEGERLVQMVSQRLVEDGRVNTLNDMLCRVCVVEDVLFAFFIWSGIMWFDTKLNVWRRLVSPDGKELIISHADAMSEYDGRLVVFHDIRGFSGVNEVDPAITKNVQCMLVSLDRVGEKICGTIDWSGIVATVPAWFDFLHCLAVSK